MLAESVPGEFRLMRPRERRTTRGRKSEYLQFLGRTLYLNDRIKYLAIKLLKAHS